MVKAAKLPGTMLQGNLTNSNLPIPGDSHLIVSPHGKNGGSSYISEAVS
jgi:hypothetical protein